MTKPSVAELPKEGTKRHQMHSKKKLPVIRNTAVTRCMLTAGCTLLPKNSKIYLKNVALNYLECVVRDAMILANESSGKTSANASSCTTLGLRHLKLALAIRNFTMLGEFVPRPRRASGTSKPRDHTPGTDRQPALPDPAQRTL